MGPTYKKLKVDTPFGSLWAAGAWTNLVIPAGTRCKRIETGSTRGKYWIDEFGWMENTPNIQLLRHDAEHYGIIVEPDAVE